MRRIADEHLGQRAQHDHTDWRRTRPQCFFRILTRGRWRHCWRWRWRTTIATCGRCIPKQAGSVAPVTLATYPDEQGTLDGKPIAVHHLVGDDRGARTDLFAGPENQLLQAELPQPGFVLVRRGSC